jgi:hypothetical protein
VGSKRTRYAGYTTHIIREFGVCQIHVGCARHIRGESDANVEHTCPARIGSARDVTFGLLYNRAAETIVLFHLSTVLNRSEWTRMLVGDT